MAPTSTPDTVIAQVGAALPSFDQLVGAVATAAAQKVFSQIGDVSAVLALHQRVTELEQQVQELAAQAPVPGPQGSPGLDGADGAPGPPGPPGAPAGPIILVL